MDRGAPARPVIRAAAVAVAATMFVSVAAPSLFAQTLTAPKAQSKALRAAPAAKAAPVARVNPCSIYGEGFAKLPGTDTCVKVGGYVRSDAGVNLGR